MSLFRKVRVLASALLHRPFISVPEKVELDGVPALGAEESRRAPSPLPASKGDLPDRERVADLIDRQRESG